MSDPSLPDLYNLESSVLPPDARVAAFRCEEGLSTLYRLSVGVVTDGGEIDLLEARGIAAKLEIQAPDGEPFVFHGMIVEASLRHAWQGHALYEVVIVPKAWVLTLSHHCRVFVDTSVPDVITTILEAGGLSSDDFELRLHGDHQPHFHTCQYKESRWAFIERLMEREGLYYYFEQGQSAEKLIITDHKSTHTALRTTPARYVPLSGTDDGMSQEAFGTFTSRSRAVPQGTLLRDFDYLKPTLDVKAEATTSSDSTEAVQMHYGEHDFRAEGPGKPKATAMAEAFAARQLTFEGRGRVFAIRPGFRFTLEEHPLDSLNTEYLAVRASHYGCHAAESPLVRELLGIPGTDDYHVTVEAIDAQVQWRAPRKTPIPRVASVERAFVDGPADSEYAQIDEHGRYKVKFHFDFDDSDLWDGDASTWVRMLQPHGGGTEGFHFPLRRKTEVMVIFLGGDPDRPVIAGAVPNATQPSPVTSSNHTQNWIQTGGASRFEIEDQEGKKYIDLYTPPENTFIHLGVPHHGHTGYIHFNTDGNQVITIGGQRDITVGGPQNETIEGALTEKFNNTQTITVTGQLKETVTGPVVETYETSHLTKVTGGGRTEIVSGDVYEGYESTLETKVDGAVTLKADGSHTVEVGGFRHVIAKAGQAQTVTGWSNVEASGGIKLDAPSIHLHASDILLNAPSVTNTSTKEYWQGCDFDVMGAKKTEVTGFAKGVTGLKIEGCGVAMSAAAYSGIRQAIRNRKAGAKVDTDGADAETKGPKSVLAAIFSIA